MKSNKAHEIKKMQWGLVETIDLFLREPSKYENRLRQEAKKLFEITHLTFENQDYQYLFDLARPTLQDLYSTLNNLAYDKAEELVEWLKRDLKAVRVDINKGVDEFIFLAKSFGFEKSHTERIGPWTVVFFSRDTPWDKSLVETARQIILKATQLIKNAGFGHTLGGTIHINPDKGVGGMFGSGNMLGLYNTSSDFISLGIGGNITFKQVVRTLVHETGHRYYYKTMDARARQNWEALFKGQIGKPPGKILDTLTDEWDRIETVRKEMIPLGKYIQMGIAPKSHLEWLQILLHYNKGVLSIFDNVDDFVDRREQLKAFLMPITSYSTSKPEELYAEAFAHIIVDGPTRVPPVIRAAFYESSPHMKRAHLVRKVAHKYLAVARKTRALPYYATPRCF